jgi:glutamyl-tRNA reductase
MRTLDDIKHREARKVIFWESTTESFEIFGLSREEIGVSKLESICKNMVRSDLNEMATLFRHNMVERHLIIEEYWWIILRSWNELEEEIRNRRESSGPHDYMRNLEEIKNKAEKYATNKYPADLEKLKQGKTASK